jgi:two-component system, cell cycle response regulator DivK
VDPGGGHDLRTLMKTIAVVEDNADNRLLVQALLEDRYRIVEFEDGPQALAGLRREPADLVLLDISLPGMDGVEVLRLLREREELRGLPVIALTAHAMLGDRERFLGAGFDGYVTKPIVDEELLFSEIERRLAS